MPWGDATRTSGGFGRWTGDHRVCLFELWSSESSGSGTSADYGSTLILNPTVEPQVATSDEQRAVRLLIEAPSRPMWVLALVLSDTLVFCRWTLAIIRLRRSWQKLPESPGMLDGQSSLL